MGNVLEETSLREQAARLLAPFPGMERFNNHVRGIFHMKKILSLALAAVMAVSLAACGGSTASGSTASTATSGSTAASAEATGAGIPKEDIKVGVVHLSDPAEGTGYSYTHEQGIQGMMKNIGLSEDQLVEKINVSDTDAAAVQNALTELVEEGFVRELVSKLQTSTRM